MKSIVMACLLLLPMSLIATSYICGADDPFDEMPIIPAPTSPELVVRIPLESRHTFSSTEASDELTVYWIKQLPVRYPENFVWYQDDEDDTGFRSRVAESAFAVVQTQRPEKKPNATVPVEKTTVVGWVYADDPPPDPHTREWLADCVFDPTSAKWYLVTGRHRTAALTLAVFPLDIDKPASDWPMREFPWLADKEKWPKPLKCQSQWRGRVDDSCSVQRLQAIATPEGLMIFVTPAADADCKQPHVYRYSFEANTWETRDKFAWKAVENEDAPTKERTNGDANPPAPVGPNELKPKPLKPTPDPKASQPASPTPVQKK